jgi:RNA polymerase sigma-70 factor (ECF subfamily)
MDLNAHMARLADGDRASFDPVFRALWPPVLRRCTGILKSEADAKDAAQETMEKILTRASSYDRSRPALPWALAIGAWECRTLLRSRFRKHEVDGDGAPEPASAELEDDLVHRDLSAAALDIMGRLSAADRETLTASFWDEGANLKGPALRKRRERALRRLRDGFRETYGLD